ncbi:polymorphic toxin-type HINT domain-containing protein [Streptomyces carpaticus]|uniref:RHS repeat-associated core domain-containing protein n=1 Tax=Streptomyces carpaticus TaxID=285558 RepID=UPI0021FE3E1C|nr:polymorphic toxin-type HINT domain-containing protein [Streptomyces carpaticus]
MKAPARPGRVRSAMRRRVSLGIAMLMVGSLLQAITAPTAVADDFPDMEIPEEHPVEGVDGLPVIPRPESHTDYVPPELPDVVWPETGIAEIPLPGSGPVPLRLDRRAPVSLLPPAGTTALPAQGVGGRPDAEVEFFGPEHAEAAGVAGLLFSVELPESSGAVPLRQSEESVGIELDYSGFAHAFGGGFGSRLTLVELPACALDTPEAFACAQPRPLPAENNTERQVLTLPETALGHGSGPSVFAVVAQEEGDKGDYKATDLSASATWDVGLNTGDFSWSYGMDVPDVPGGLAPEIGLSYSAGGIDGRTGGTNNQGSWVGDGFDLWPGYIERRYKPCAEEGVKDSHGNRIGDLCWDHENAFISVNGAAGELVPDGNNTWKLQQDDGTRIEKLTGTGRANGARNDEHWRMTTPDGTQYYFGYHRLPGWSSGATATNSTWTVPVYGNDSGDPCHASAMKDAWCQQAWRWNLDYVVDVRGNAIAYYYNKEENSYGRFLTAKDNTRYTRGGSLDRIEYGLSSDNLYGTALAKVDFTNGDRCLPGGGANCSSIGTYPQYWYDTPWDLNCGATADCDKGRLSPTFWTTKRLTEVTTQVRVGTGYQKVDSWKLNHRWGTADVDYQLLLADIRHTGHTAAAPSTLPPVTFGYTQLTNRLDVTGDGYAPFIKARLSSIADESGGQIDVTYSEPACVRGSLPTPETNTTRCFPQYLSTGPDSDPDLEWFNKYVVTAVSATDRTGGADDQLTRYDYRGGAAWHYDDDNGMVPEKEKTWSQWRGYGHVRVQSGGQSGMLSQSDSYFLRGMHGDRRTRSGGTKTVTVSLGSGEGDPITDHAPLAGFLYKSVEFDAPGGKVLEKTVARPWHHETAKDVRDWGTITANFTGVAHDKSWTSLDAGAGSNWRTTERYQTYDTVAGRLVQTDDRGDTATAADDQCTRVTYADNTAKNILSLPSRVETVAVRCSGTPDRARQVISDERYAYDGENYGAAPTLGDVTRSAVLKEHDGTTATYLESAGTYDDYGRRLTATDLAADVTVVGTDITRRARTDGRANTTSFSPATGFPTRVTETTPPATEGDATTAQRSVTEVDPLRGLPVKVTDTNGKVTDLSYDAFGRSSKVWLPDRTTSATPNFEFTYRFAENQPVVVGTKTLGNQGRQDTSYVLYDGFLRERQTQAPGPQGGRLLTDTFYDERGLVAKSFAPYFNDRPPAQSFFLPGQDASGVETQFRYRYDGLGRETENRMMAGDGDGGKVLAVTQTSYRGDRTTVIPPEGATATTTITDARGQLSELRQHHQRSAGAAFDSTRYEFTPRGELAKVTDPAGNEWTYTYDQLGRRVSTTDPDAGTTVSVFDDRDLLTHRTDAREVTLAYEYDGLGRKIRLRETDLQGPVRAEWEYDTLPGAQGLLAASTRYEGGSAYTNRVLEVDALYRPLRTEVEIPESEGALAGRYESGTTYAASGKPEQIRYPAAGRLPALTLQPTYEDGTLRLTHLRTPQRLHVETTHTSTGKPSLVSFRANEFADESVTVGNVYEPGTQRLKSVQAVAFRVPGNQMLEEYEYDQAGNVLSLSSKTATGAEVQCFQYDYLRRLTEAWTQGTNTDCASTPTANLLSGPAPYWHSYTYDETGNRLTETRHEQSVERTYQYPEAGEPQSHAVTSVIQEAPGIRSLEEYAYDEAGNTISRQIGGDTQELTWSAEGGLEKVEEADGAVTEYLYDADGQRLIGRTPTETTLYLGHTEVTVAKGSATARGTRYVDAGGGHMVIFEDSGDISFSLADHHGTGQVSVDGYTMEVNHRRTLPFGGDRGPAPAYWPGTRGFVGGTKDTSTGLTHLGAREYDPNLGRFISLDPLMDLTDPQQIHGYTYGNNNPLAFSDPTGLFFGGLGNLARVAQKAYSAAKNLISRARDQVGQSSSAQRTAVWKSNSSTSTVSVSHRNSGNFSGATSAGSGPGGGIYRQFAAAQFMAERMVHGFAEVAKEGLLSFVPDFEGAMNCIKDINWIDCGGLALDIVPLGRIVKLGVRKLDPDLFRAISNDKCNSFVPGTRVLLADGSAKPIEELEVGNEVLATDPETGESSARAVTAELSSFGEKSLVSLVLQTDEGEESVVATAAHPFWDADLSSWVDAGDIDRGTSLLTASGNTTQVHGTHSRASYETVHNLTVEGVHTYYVLVGDIPVLVHNSGGCAPRSPDGKYSKRNGEPGRDGAADEANAWNQLEVDGAVVMRNETPVVAPGLRVRKYDGTVQIDGQWYGIEVKGGSANKTPQQREFDDWLNTPGNTVTTSDGRTLVGVHDVWIDR